MNSTRRSFLRDASLVSAAASLSATPFLAGCRKTRFEEGIRVYFAGAWLFCGVPRNTLPGYMYAITVNPAEPAQTGQQPVQFPCPYPMPPDAMAHRFPYGVWDKCGEIASWDKRHSRELCPNYQLGKPSLGHYVNVLGTWHGKGKTSLDALFRAANKDGNFIYLPSSLNDSSKPYTLNMAQCNLRIITLPIPTRIIPAAFRPDVSVSGETKRLMLPQSARDRGIATTHILEYRGAQGMVFSPGDGTQPDQILRANDYTADYHFHSVPKKPHWHHAPNMFNHLFGVVNDLLRPDSSGVIRVALNIDPPCPPLRPVPGTLVPSSVDNDELEMACPPGVVCIQNCPGKDGLMNLTLASCCSGGGGTCNIEGC